MPSNPLPMRALRFLPLLPLCALLSACMTAPIQVTQGALPCADLVKSSGLLSRTAGAPLPADDTAGSLAAFGIQQTGQLEHANADKAGVQGILETCQAWQDKAAQQARPKAWWKFWG